MMSKGTCDTHGHCHCVAVIVAILVILVVVVVVVVADHCLRTLLWLCELVIATKHDQCHSWSIHQASLLLILSRLLWFNQLIFVFSASFTHACEHVTNYYQTPTSSPSTQDTYYCHTISSDVRWNIPSYLQICKIIYLYSKNLTLH